MEAVYRSKFHSYHNPGVSCFHCKTHNLTFEPWGSGEIIRKHEFVQNGEFTVEEAHIKLFGTNVYTEIQFHGQDLLSKRFGTT